MPAVSALMVFHRDTPFLRPAIASVLEQTFTDLELVLVDNGTGLPVEAVGELARDPRLRWVRLARNEGIPAGHNAGVAAARGEFIALLDYDDIALPQRLERQVARLCAEPSLGLVSSLAETIDERGAVVGREFSLVEPAAQRAYVPFAAPIVTPAYTGRRELFQRFPYRAEFSFAADFDFLTRAIEGAPAAAVPEVLLHYRRYSAQTTQEKGAVIEDQCSAIRLLAARRRRGGNDDASSIAAWLAGDGSPAASCRRWAGRCLDERFFVLAAFQARRAVALERTPACALQTFALATRAICRAGDERRLAARMFFTGPVRALGLRPA